ncbi:hypothetical protein [Photobacterium sp. 1_MG-2023]|uniref:hypothetical protein n=1 Tax=Photobacterium sp. 1_MG-2023 TaxID=3062646 RepID=UPI0026E12FE6|nr:hypothetical protein [Photobacterium sp. 1_MG-2023]MDO6706670.1 hypothetical protein [Photobacterium sp. 1_MG-2023]
MRENTVQTQSNVYLESENITIQPNEHYKEYSIKAGNIEISAEKSYISSGLIYAENIKIAANKIVHSGGEAFALDSLYVNGITSIQNSHQGIFVGSNVALTSQNTIINGIFKPWNCQKPRSSSQFGSNVHHPKDEIEIGSGKGIIKDFINTCKGSALLTDWSKSQRTASIFGFNLSLSAPEIINSNPYIKQRKEYKDPTVNMQITDSNTVSISAENAMVIHAKNALKNGSGVIEVLNGNMSINAPSINNQRYFIHAKTHTKHVKKPLPHICTENGFWEWMVDMGYDDVMAPIDYPEMHEEVRDIKSKCSKIKNTTDIIDEQYISALSPVGRMLVAGNLILNGNKILNEASNFEIWGKMNGSLKEIKSLGLVLKEKIVQQQITQHEKRYCSRRVFGACLKRKTERWTTTSHQLIKHDVTAQFPALFDINKANINVANGKITTGNITFGK